MPSKSQPGATSKHWSFQPIRRPRLPAVKNSFTPLERTRDVYPWDPV